MLRGVLRLPPDRGRRALHGRRLLGSAERRRQGRHRLGDDPRDRGRGPALPRDDERLRVHGRRDGDGAPRRAAAQGHGVHAVPPDDDVPVGDPDHGGLPRRGRLPDQQGRRALHEALRAERARARVARRRLPLGDDRDRGGARRQRLGDARPAPSRAREDPQQAPGLARARDDLRGRRPDLRADPRAAGRPLPHGRRRRRTSGG